MKQKFTVALVTINSIFSLYFSSAWGNGKKDFLYWIETGYSTQEFLQSNNLTDQFCYLSEENFKSCFASFEGILLAHDQMRRDLDIGSPHPHTSLRVVPFIDDFSWGKELDSVKKTIIEKGVLLIEEDWLLNLSSHVYRQKQKRFQSIKWELTKKYFHRFSGSPQKISFENVFVKLRDLLITDARYDALTAGLALSEKYKVSRQDPHADIYPSKMYSDKLERPDETTLGMSVPQSAVGEVAHQTERPVQIPNIYGFPMKSNQGMKLGYLRVLSFVDSKLCEKAQELVLWLETQEVDAYILDLRNNGGGLIMKAACLAGLFLGPKTVFYSRSVDIQTGEMEEPIEGQTNEGQTNGILSLLKFDYSEKALTLKPVVVLVNSNSASASEIVAGSLQDYQRAWIVGETTFGKGSIQTPFQIREHLLAQETNSIFLLPSLRTIQSLGVQPDFLVNSPQYLDGGQRGTYLMREEDYTQSHLQVFEGGSWKQPREKSVAIIQKCVNSDPNDFQEGDPYIQTALEILSCDQKIEWHLLSITGVDNKGWNQ